MQVNVLKFNSRLLGGKHLFVNGTFVTCPCMRTTATAAFYLEGRLVRFSLVGRRNLHPDG